VSSLCAIFAIIRQPSQHNTYTRSISSNKARKNKTTKQQTTYTQASHEIKQKTTTPKTTTKKQAKYHMFTPL
jgi:hypothetical protein